MDSLNSNLINQIQQELQVELPFETGDLQPPYNDNLSFDEKFKVTYRELRRSIQLKNRLLSLINAFYLGKLLNEIESTHDRFQYKRRLTNHYMRIAENTFDTFEVKPTAIFNTITLTAQIMRKITRPNIIQLREFLQTIDDDVIITS